MWNASSFWNRRSLLARTEINVIGFFSAGIKKALQPAGCLAGYISREVFLCFMATGIFRASCAPRPLALELILQIFIEGVILKILGWGLTVRVN